MKDFKRREIGVEPIDLALDPIDLRVGDGEPRAAGAFFRQAEIGLDVEQVVLNAPECRIERGVARSVQADEADRGVDFVERAVGGHAQIVFLAAVAGAERRRAVVAGAGVDAIQYDHDDLLGVLMSGNASSEFCSNVYSILAENDEEESMRFIAIVAIAVLLAGPAATSASSAAQNTDISARRRPTSRQPRMIQIVAMITMMATNCSSTRNRISFCDVLGEPPRVMLIRPSTTRPPPRQWRSGPRNAT